MTAPTSRPTSHIEHHPDLVDLRARYERTEAAPTAQAIEGLSMLTGLYLAIFPWVAGFNGAAGLAVSNLITGIALAVLAMGLGSVYERTHGMGWIPAAIGVWTIIAPWSVAGHADTTRAIISNVITGALTLVMCLAMMAMERRGRY